MVYQWIKAKCLIFPCIARIFLENFGTKFGMCIIYGNKEGWNISSRIHKCFWLYYVRKTASRGPMYSYSKAVVYSSQKQSINQKISIALKQSPTKGLTKECLQSIIQWAFVYLVWLDTTEIFLIMRCISAKLTWVWCVYYTWR